MAKQRKRKQLKDEEFLKLIGDKIRQYRTEKGLSQTALAIACKDDLDYSQISRMERGTVNFSITYLKTIAQALDLNPQDLLP